MADAIAVLGDDCSWHGIQSRAHRAAGADRELASLRASASSRREIAGMLLIELLVQLLIALPIGLYLGKWSAHAMIAMHDTALFEIPTIIHPRSYALVTIVLLLSGVARALLVGRRVAGLDLVAVLKTRE